MFQDGMLRKFSRALLAALLVVACLPLGQAFADDQKSRNEESFDELLVVLDDRVDGSRRARGISGVQSLEATGLEVVEEVIEANEDFGTVLTVTVDEGKNVDQLINEVSALPGVAYAQPNFVYSLPEDTGATESAVDSPEAQAMGEGSSIGILATSVNDSDWTSEQKYLHDVSYGVNIENAWDEVDITGGKQVTVAVLDTGYRTSHEDLQGNLYSEYMWDAHNETTPGTITSSGVPYGDNNGHGSHVAGTVAATTNNGKGIAGVAFNNAKLLPIKVFDDEYTDPGAGTDTLIKAYNYLFSLVRSGDLDDLHVINMSLGGYGYDLHWDALLENAVKIARDQYDIASVCAGGNGINRVPQTQGHYPSDYPASIAVTSLTTTGNGAHSSWSDYNEFKDISAPGERIYATGSAHNKYYLPMSGTSMASPIVSGILALMWSGYPELTVDEAEAAIKSTADARPDGRGTNGTAGKINAFAAIQKLKETYDDSRVSIDTCTVAEPSSKVYTGSALTTEIAVTDQGRSLVEGIDFEVGFSNNVEAGSAYATVKGIGDYRGYRIVPFAITPTEISNAVVSGIAQSYIYNDKGWRPAPTIKFNGKPLTQRASYVDNPDYYVSYANYYDAGTATLTITGLGNFKGTVVKNYTITQAPVSSIVFSGAKASYVYTGKPIMPELTASFGTLEPTQIKWFTPSYYDNKNAGTARISIRGYYNFTGTTTKTFKIMPKPITGTQVTGIESTYVHIGDAIKPTPTVKDGTTTLQAGKDYTVSYKNNNVAGIAMVIVAGKGNYSGAISKTFKITKRPTTWTRLAGNDRYATMQKIVKTGFAWANTVIIATGENFPDALAASGIAGIEKAPVVTTTGKSLDKRARSEIERLGATKAILIGGTSSLSQSIEKSLQKMGIYNIVRVSGASREQTAVRVYQSAPRAYWGSTAIVASGQSFADALSISSYAYAKCAPIFLTGADKKLPAEAVNAIKRGSFSKVIITGGTASVSDAVESSQLKGIVCERKGGATRYETSRVIASWALKQGMSANNMAVATGASFPDALAGAALCGSKNSVLLLAADDASAKAQVGAFLTANKYKQTQCYVLGGESAISPTLFNHLKAKTK